MSLADIVLEMGGVVVNLDEIVPQPVDIPGEDVRNPPYSPIPSTAHIAHTPEVLK